MYKPLVLPPNDLLAAMFAPTDKALKYRGMATAAANELKSNYIIGNSGDTYSPTLLRLWPDKTVSVESNAALQKQLIDRFSGRETISVIKREVTDMVLGLLADNEMVQMTDIRPFFFESEVPAEHVYAWHRLAFDPDLDAPEVPEYEEMRKRADPSAFKAQTEFFGSILDYEFLSEQYLHLSGEGNDGKSSLLQAIRGALPPGFATAIQAADLDSAHGLAKIEGKRLLVFSEENSAGFMSSGRFKQLTGRDPISINPKNQAERECVPNCRVIVTSNSKPSISGKAADSRRIIPVFYESFGDGSTSDQGWSGRLKERGSDILRYCYAQYIKGVKLPGGQRIAPPADALDALQGMSVGEAIAEEFLELFEPTNDPAEFAPAGKAAQAIRRYGKDRTLQGQIRDYATKLVKRTGGRTGPRVISGYRLRGKQFE